MHPLLQWCPFPVEGVFCKWGPYVYDLHKEFEGSSKVEKQMFCAFEFELEREVAGADAIWCFGVPLAPTVERAISCAATEVDHVSDNSYQSMRECPCTPPGDSGLLTL